MPKPKVAPKSKEEIARQLAAQSKRNEQLKFIKEQFWPALSEASESIEDAQTFLQGFNSALMNSFLAAMQEKKFGEYKLSEKLDPKHKLIEPQRKLVELFNEFTVFEAKTLIEGMTNEINTFIQDEKRKRPLATLHPTWIDEVAKIVNEE